MPGLRALGALYLERQTFHVNANILAASLTGTAATALASAHASGLGWGPNAVAAAGTASNALVFVPVQLALHYLVVRLQARRTGELEVRRRYWRETRLIWATGLPAIAVFLTLFTLGQSLILRLGLRPLATTALAYVAAQAMGRLVHTLLLRFTSLGKAPAR
jgi:hypothetical protein